MPYVSVSGLTSAAPAQDAAVAQTAAQNKMLDAIRRAQAVGVADEDAVQSPAPPVQHTRTAKPRATVVVAPPPPPAEVRVAPAPPATASFQADCVPDADTLPPLPDLVHPRLRTPLTSALHISEMTRIQRLSWSAMVDPDRDVLLRSETGSGKTLAYALPCMHALLHACDAAPIRRDVGTLVIVMCPTRELVLQVCDTLSTLLRAAPFITVGGIHGGDNRHREKARLRKGVTVLVATPGRLLDHLKTTSAFVVSGLRTIVMDEADRLLDLGFERAVHEIMQCVEAACAHPRSLKRVLVSATITAGVERLSHFTLRRAVVRVGETEDTFTVPATLRQHVVVVPTKHRLAVLLAFLRSQFDAGAHKVVLFVATADCAEFLYYLVSRLPSPFATRGAGGGRRETLPQQTGKHVKRLTERANRHLTDATQEVVTFDADDRDDDEDAGVTKAKDAPAALLDVNVFKLHGNMTQLDRASVFRAFQHDLGPDAKGLLCCTDVAARGLDLPHVDWIVHYDPPADPTSYIHRVGRTARIGRSGDSILFLAPHEAGYADYLAHAVRDHAGAAPVMQTKKFETFLFYLTKLDPGANHLWAHSTAALERAISQTVMHAPSDAGDDLGRIALFAYQSYIRAYAGMARELKAAFFPASALHLGHVARSFGIDKSPSEVQRQLRGHIRADRVLARDNRKGTTATGVKRQRVELEHDDRYHSMLAQRQRKLTRDWAERRRETSTKIRPLQFGEFDA